MEQHPISSLENEQEIRKTAGLPHEILVSGYRPDLAELEAMYGEQSEKLAQNTALLWTVEMNDVLLDLEQSTTHSATLSRRLKDQNITQIIEKMTDSERRTGYSLLATMYSSYDNYDSESVFGQSLKNFLGDLGHLAENHDRMDAEETKALMQQLSDQAKLYRDWGLQYLEGVLDDRPMSHEGGDLSDFHHELYLAFCKPFLTDVKVMNNSPETISQFQRRIICEAQFLFRQSAAFKKRRLFQSL